MEMGRYSNQLYQPIVNHRRLNYNVMNHTHGTSRSVNACFANPADDESFNEKTMVFTMYQRGDIAEGSQANPDLMLRSLGGCATSASKMPVDGFIADAEYCLISCDSFHRLLNFFGFNWVDEEGERVARDPSAHEILSFTQMIGTIPGTPDEFKKQLKSWKMESIFGYDNTHTLEWNLNSFGWCTRSFVDARIGIVEGQHRVDRVVGHTVGTQESSSLIPISFREVNQYPADSQDKSKWQSYSVYLYVIAQPPSEESNVGNRIIHLTKLRQRSKTSKKISEKGVKADALSVLADLADMAMKKFGTELLDDSFDTMWNEQQPYLNSTIRFNHENLFSLLDAECKGDVQVISAIVDKPANVMLADTYATVYVDSIKHAFNKSSGGFGQKGNESRFPTQLKRMFWLMKGLLTTKAGCRAISMMYRKDFYSNQRHPLAELPLSSLFLDIGFAHRCLEICKLCGEHLYLKLVWELKIIANMKAADEPTRAKMFSKLSRGQALAMNEVVPDSRTSGHAQLKVPLEGESATATNLGHRTCEIGYKANDSFVAALTTDMIETIARLGFDPQLYASEAVATAASMKPQKFYERGERTNYGLKIYLSSKDEHRKIPKFTHIPYNFQDACDVYKKPTRKVPAQKSGKPGKTKKGQKGPEKYSIEVLIELYPYFLKHKLSVFEIKLVLLRFSLVDNGCSIVYGDGLSGINARHRSILSSALSLCPNEFKFSKFVAEVENGTFNTDLIVPFTEHIDKEISELNLTQAVRLKFSGVKPSTPVALRVLPSIPVAAAEAKVDDEAKQEETEVAPKAATVAQRSASKPRNSTGGFGAAYSSLNRVLEKNSELSDEQKMQVAGRLVQSTGHMGTVITSIKLNKAGLEELWKDETHSENLKGACKAALELAGETIPRDLADISVSNELKQNAIVWNKASEFNASKATGSRRSSRRNRYILDEAEDNDDNSAVERGSSEGSSPTGAAPGDEASQASSPQKSVVLFGVPKADKKIQNVIAMPMETEDDLQRMDEALKEIYVAIDSGIGRAKVSDLLAEHIDERLCSNPKCTFPLSSVPTNNQDNRCVNCEWNYFHIKSGGKCYVPCEVQCDRALRTFNVCIPCSETDDISVNATRCTVKGCDSPGDPVWTVPSMLCEFCQNHVHENCTARGDTETKKAVWACLDCSEKVFVTTFEDEDIILEDPGKKGKGGNGSDLVDTDDEDGENKGLEKRQLESPKGDPNNTKRRREDEKDEEENQDMMVDEEKETEEKSEEDKMEEDGKPGEDEKQEEEDETEKSAEEEKEKDETEKESTTEQSEAK